MAEKVKSPILLLIVLILVSLSLAGGVFFLLQKEKAKNLALQEDLEDIRTRQKVTEAKLEESKKIASGLELRLQEAKSQIDRLGSELEQEKTARQEALTQVEQLRVDLEQQKTLRADIEKKLGQAQKDVDKIQNQVKELLSRKVELDRKVKDLEAAQSAEGQGVELGKVVVTPEAAIPTTKTAVKSTSEKPISKSLISASEGKILVVNKDYNFAVVNLGSRDGVDIGQIFSIYHNNKYIGDLKVEKVHDAMSAAGFVNVDMKDKINEGDRVVQKTK